MAYADYAASLQGRQDAASLSPTNYTGVQVSSPKNGKLSSTWKNSTFGCQLDEPCCVSGDHWQVQQCFNVFTDTKCFLYCSTVVFFGK